ncbi:MAG: Ldh family oxidoreductase, partial [Gemmatimonadota bacterium]|nr:Ldh family oxidoreductase [Gemmatimonadota bacterium]
AIAVPGSDGRTISLDMATSVAAFGKLDVAVDRGESIPDTWALDGDGHPTTDPREARFLQPAAGYKGYGLALIFECLSSLMVGNPLLTAAISGPGARPGVQNSFIGAIDIAAFTDPDVYRRQIDELVSAMKGLPRVDGVDELFVPGEPEEVVHRERIEHGIPLPVGTRDKLIEVAEKLGLKVPWEA